MLLDKFVLDQINQYADKLEKKFDADVIYYNGPTHFLLINHFRDLIERIASYPNKKQRLCVFIKTSGGAVEPVEKMVDIIRHHYETVWFFVPDFAMSAGTIFCLSGDKIYMDYSSSLGPIDPQVMIKENGIDKYVPALGVLEQVEKLVKKAQENTLTGAEFAILQNQNLAVLSSYEHARELSVDLAKKWLVKYKFKNWSHHRTDPEKLGKEVTPEEKETRAADIVGALVNHAAWHSHARFIGPRMLKNVLKLEIDEYPDAEATMLIRCYSDLLTDYIERAQHTYYMHHKGITVER